MSRRVGWVVMALVCAVTVVGVWGFCRRSAGIHDRQVHGTPGVSADDSQRSAYAPPQETPEFQSLLSLQDEKHLKTLTVKPGDNLTIISKKYRVTIDLLKKLNHLRTHQIAPGMKLQIPTYRFSLVVDKSQNLLMFKGDEEVLKTYTVSTGRNNSTPVGVFKIKDKITKPTWFKDGGKGIPYGDPRNWLGTRWMGFNIKGYGIHGTVEPEQLGRQVTDGCVRMKNEEVEELFTWIPLDTEVTIVD